MLGPNLKHYVYIHVPVFLLQTYEPLIATGAMILLDEGLVTVLKFISVTMPLEINQKTNQCNEYPTYNFQLCVRKSLNKKVGCRLPWDSAQTRTE